MKILHVLNDVAAGGAQTLVEHLAQHRQPGQSLHLVVLLGPDVLSPRMESAFTTVTYLQVGRGPSALARGIAGLRRETLRVQPDIVHSHLTQSDLVSVLTPSLGASRVSTTHNSADATSGLGSRVALWMLQRASSRLDVIVACDDSAEHFARATFRAHHVAVVPNGTAVPPLTLPASQAPRPYFLSLAGFRPQKRHDRMLEAFGPFSQSHPEWDLIMAGGGISEQNTELVRLVHRSVAHPERVQLLGALASTTDLLSRAKALLISSDYEGLPMAALESLAVGTPVVTTPVGGCPKTAAAPGFVAKSLDASDLTQSMFNLARLSPAEYDRARIASHALALSQFDIRASVAMYDRVYSKLRAERLGGPMDNRNVPLLADLKHEGLSGARLLTVRALATVACRLAAAAGRRSPWLGHALKQLNHLVTGADIAWQAEIGARLRLYHPTGVVIGPHVRIGSDCRIQQGVTLGGLGGDESLAADSPTLGDRVQLGAGCRVIGGVRLGDDVVVGANAVVVRDVPKGTTVVGVPARPLSKSGGL